MDLGKPNARFLTAKEKAALWRALKEGKAKVIPIKHSRRHHAKQN